MMQKFYSWVHVQKKTKILLQIVTSTPIFTASLFATVRTWKQPNVCQQRNGKEDVAHVSSGMHSALKRKTAGSFVGT